MTAKHPTTRTRANPALRGPKRRTRLPVDPEGWWYHTRTLSYEARCILMDLSSWMCNSGYIPRDEKVLAGWCGMHIRRFRNHFDQVLPFFTDPGDGWLYPNPDNGIEVRDNSRPHIPTAVRQTVMERDEFTCQECGSNEDLALDHIYPYSLGGADTPENLRVLCRPCNSRKGASVPEGV